VHFCKKKIKVATRKHVFIGNFFIYSFSHSFKSQLTIIVIKQWLHYHPDRTVRYIFKFCPDGTVQFLVYSFVQMEAELLSSFFHCSSIWTDLNCTVVLKNEYNVDTNNQATSVSVRIICNTGANNNEDNQPRISVCQVLTAYSVHVQHVTQSGSWRLSGVAIAECCYISMIYHL